MSWSPELQMSFCLRAGSAPFTKPSVSSRTRSPSTTWPAMRWSPRRRATTRSLGPWSANTWERSCIKSAPWSSRYFTLPFYFVLFLPISWAEVSVHATTLCFMWFRTLWRTAKLRSKANSPSCWRTCRTPSGPSKNRPLLPTHPHPSAVQQCRFKWPVF